MAPCARGETRIVLEGLQQRQRAGLRAGAQMTRSARQPAAGVALRRIRLIGPEHTRRSRRADGGRSPRSRCGPRAGLAAGVAPPRCVRPAQPPPWLRRRPRRRSTAEISPSAMASRSVMRIVPLVDQPRGCAPDHIAARASWKSMLRPLDPRAQAGNASQASDETPRRAPSSRAHDDVAIIGHLRPARRPVKRPRT